MLRRALLPARGDVNTSLRYWGSGSVSPSVTSWRRWCSEHYQARRWTTLSTTVSSWPPLDGEPRSAERWVCLVPRRNHAASNIGSVTDRLLLLVHEFGTTCLPNSATLDRQSKPFEKFENCTYSISWGRGAFVTVWFLCAVCKCSYLLTNLLTSWVKMQQD